MSSGAPMTARARARAELTQEIKAEARRQVAVDGSSALSLRAVARELGMVSSAVYRYFASRDELLTALIIDAYDAVGAAAEGAAGEARRGVGPRWLSVAQAIRRWACSNPHDYALVYGSPVPGYRAPADTIASAARVSLVALRLIGDGLAAGEIEASGHAVAVPRAVHADFALLRGQVGIEIPDAVLSRALMVWTELFGTITFELFGHLHNVIRDYDAFFDHQMRRAGQFLVGGQ